MMTVRELFDAAMQLPSSERSAWLVAQKLEPAMAVRVAALIAAQDDARNVLDRPFAEQLEGLIPQQNIDTGSALIGSEIGSYRLVRLLGQGGMASVFAAERVGADFQQQVAVKLLRRTLHTDLELRLFQRERQALAALEHPNIARLLDGGVTDAGVPYLVMELVQGLDLLSFARQNSLSLRARLALFAQVCDAVNAAHRALIVHRDIKPANILVTDSGQAKLLDFGIAKLLDNEETNQPTTYAPLTPEYAAPEQFDGRAITTATDVYGLGIVLHELLLGMRPKRGDTARASDLVGTHTTIEQPKTPITASELKRFLRGDIDNILRQSLNPEPNERYVSAGELAADVRRFLDGQPVQAHPPSGWYRVQKFVRRNRFAVAACSVLLIGLIGSLLMAMHQAQQARAEGARANATRDFLVSLFEIAQADTPQDEKPTPEQIVELGGDRILTAQDMAPETKADLLAVLARVALSMGASAQAQELTDALLPLSQQLYQPFDPRWVSARHLRALALSTQAQLPEALALLEPMRETLLQRGDALSIEVLLSLARVIREQGGHIEEALSLQRRITELALKNAQSNPRSVLQAMIYEAEQFSMLHRYTESLERAESALAFQKAQALPLSSDILTLQGSIANSASAMGDAVRGEAAYREAIALSERLHRRPHADTAWYVGVLGSYLVSLGRYDEAEPYVLRGLSMRRDLLGEAHPNTLFAFAALARLRASQTRVDEALSALSEPIALCAKQKLQHQACVRALQIRGQMLGGKADFAAAEADLNAAITLQRQISGEDGAMVASQFAALAQIQRYASRYDDAIGSIERALALFEKAGSGKSSEANLVRFQRAWINEARGRYQAALDEITEVEALHAKHTPDDFINRLRILRVKASALSKLKRTEEAKQAATWALTMADKIYNKQREAKLLESLKRLAATGLVE